MRKLLLFALSVITLSFSAPQANIDVVVDFTGYQDANVVEFVDSKGKSTVFNSADGPYQTKRLKVDVYTINWSIDPAVSSSWLVLFHYSETAEALMLPEAPGGNVSVTGVALQEIYTFSLNFR